MLALCKRQPAAHHFGAGPPPRVLPVAESHKCTPHDKSGVTLGVTLMGSLLSVYIQRTVTVLGIGLSTDVGGDWPAHTYLQVCAGQQGSDAETGQLTAAI
eukprot:1159869-Pelagomonas_calceolata.AAC.4